MVIPSDLATNVTPASDVDTQRSQSQQEIQFDCLEIMSVQENVAPVATAVLLPPTNY